MKLSKKVLAAFSAATLIMTAGIFTSCGEEKADDENEMISGSNNNYTLSYDNSASSTTSRGYVPTKKNHRGALVQITLNKEGTSGSGAAMGYIWDLKSEDAAASAEELSRAVSDKARNFCIVAFANHDGKVMPYVSRYENVYDIQADNFGTKSGVDVNGVNQKAVETEYLGWSSTSKKATKALTKDSEGNYVMTVNVHEEPVYGDETDSTKVTGYTGSYIVDIYNGAVAKDELATTDVLVTTTIPATDLGYEATTNGAIGQNHAVAQKQGAVYANVYKQSKASGTWKYADTYSADEVVED